MLENYFKRLVKNNVFPGCNYAIIHNDKLEIGSVGAKALVPEIEKNDINTLYDLASLTKVLVTNVLITKLLDENKIKLRDKIKTYLPKFKYDNITIFHLLTHSSGLIADVNWEKVNSKDELIEFFYNKKLYYETGTDVIYSDLNFMFLGFVVEKLYGKSLDVLAYEKIFKPLHMNNTTFNPNNKKLCAPTEVTKKRGIVRGIVHDEKTWMMNGVSGAAGVFSNIFDLVKFVMMILNNGMIGNKKYIDKKYIDLWAKPFVKGKEKNVRGLGWGVGKSKITGSLCSNNTIYHTGFTGNTLIIDRENKIAFILLSNRIHPTRDNKLLANKRKYIVNYIYKNIGKIHNS